MTHFLRLHHDAILVGVGTAVADDPSLSCRYPGVTLDKQPRPVIVDPNLRWSSTEAAVVRLAEGQQGKDPLVVCRQGNVHSVTSSHVEIMALRTDGLLDWHTMLRELKTKGINSIMIEGGATILNALLMQPELVDSVIVTVAPTWLGRGGVHVSPEANEANGVRQNSARLTDTAWKQFGADAVLCGRLERC
ncbi:hypothetical protein AMS68_003983 [Peltaster fructicola]|uniref:2,5-diamino-6-ribosylamino-4(3H)-pyrimidinone 5'-phosphate reductase n=1 Tax=Peltaster fructicola TaxID=286661 RepID=A0A6H0XUV6_9PEZI|nr:hypothetical protein AMS68_003983 [Peltaster fructicola]